MPSCPPPEYFLYSCLTSSPPTKLPPSGRLYIPLNFIRLLPALGAFLNYVLQSRQNAEHIKHHNLHCTWLKKREHSVFMFRCNISSPRLERMVCQILDRFWVSESHTCFTSQRARCLWEWLQGQLTEYPPSWQSGASRKDTDIMDSHCHWVIFRWMTLSFKKKQVREIINKTKQNKLANLHNWKLILWCHLFVNIIPNRFVVI